MTNRVNRSAIYARFSSDKQSERSVDDQVALCRTYCERNELSVVGVYDDRAISGASTVNRLGWEKLMRDARGANSTWWWLKLLTVSRETRRIWPVSISACVHGD